MVVVHTRRLAVVLRAGATHAPAPARAAAARHMSTAKSYTSELERALRTQDPHDRIMFEPPMRFAAFGGMMTLRVLDLKAVRVTAHLLPFYNIAMISHLRWFGYNAATGRRPHGSNQLATRTSYTSLEGCTVAAVPRDHWAFGVAFNDDVVQIAGSPSASVMPEPFSNAPRHRGFRGYETISNSVSPYWNDVPRAVQSLAPFDPRGNHDPNTAPLFAYGPPQFTRIEQEAIVNRQNHFRESDDDMVEARQLEQDMEVYAFPQYRLVYKAELKDGGVVIADASDSDDKRMWRLDPFTPSSLSLRHSYSPDRSTAFGEISRFWRDNFMDSRPFAGIVLDDVRTDALYNIVLESMLRNPVSATTWENPLLLPCKSKEQPGIKDMAAVRDYAMVNCMLGASSPLAPTYFKVSTSATLSPHLQKKKAAAPTPPPRPAASASPQTRLGHGRHTAQKPPARQIPSHLLQSRHSDAARQSLMRRVGGQVDRQRGWQAVTEQKAKAAAEAAKREQQTRAAKGRMLPQERPLADRLGYYKVLGLAVTNDFIDYTMEVAINKRLKDQRNQMIIANHPDYSLSAVEEERRTKRAAEINVAFDHLETCEDRVKYHNAHRR